MFISIKDGGGSFFWGVGVVLFVCFFFCYGVVDSCEGGLYFQYKKAPLKKSTIENNHKRHLWRSMYLSFTFLMIHTVMHVSVINVNKSMPPANNVKIICTLTNLSDNMFVGIIFRILIFIISYTVK